MKCKCKDDKCKTFVRFDSLSRAMIVSREDDASPLVEILVYLDPNGCVELIHEIKRCLDQMVEGTE